MSHGTPVQPGETSNLRIRQNEIGDPPEQVIIVVLFREWGMGEEAQEGLMEPPGVGYGCGLGKKWQRECQKTGIVVEHQRTAKQRDIRKCE